MEETPPVGNLSAAEHTDSNAGVPARGFRFEDFGHDESGAYRHPVPLDKGTSSAGFAGPEECVVSDNLSVERVELQKKDKSELQTIVAALGGKPPSRATKADLVNAVLELSGVVETVLDSPRSDPAPAVQPEEAPAEELPFSAENAGDQPSQSQAPRTEAQPAERAPRPRRGKKNTEPPAEWETEVDNDARPARSDAPAGRQQQNDQKKQNGNGDRSGGNQPKGDRPNAEKSNADNKQHADKQHSDKQHSDKQHADKGASDKGSSDKGNADKGNADKPNGDKFDGGNDKNGEEGDGSNRRRRRRGRGRDRDDEQLPAMDSIEAAGYLDLRDDGYGFLRVNGYLQSVEDVYVPVKMARLYGLRKGDLVQGTARPANRNEKNPALQSITSINGADPELSKSRLRFEDLTAISPFERLRLEAAERPSASAARLVDLVAPIGKGQRGLIVAPPESGSLELIKQLAGGVETNNPEAHLMVLLFDGRPEDVVEVTRSLEFGEVAAASFDAPPEEQCALVDFTVERAKRMVEGGEDVVIIADGLTSIARAYSLGVQPSGRTIAGVDAAALHPTKRFFGAARKLEEAGSLTILATIRVGTGAIFDEAIFEEFQGTATSEVHLDAWLADEGVFPNIDLELSTTRNADLLAEPDDLAAVDALRALMAAAIDEADGPAVDAARRLVERLEASTSNEAFLAGIAKAKSL